jgi:hypothetical protein
VLSVFYFRFEIVDSHLDEISELCLGNLLVGVSSLFRMYSIKTLGFNECDLSL